MLIISITLLILVVVFAAIRETKPEHADMARKNHGNTGNTGAY